MADRKTRRETGRAAGRARGRTAETAPRAGAPFRLSLRWAAALLAVLVLVLFHALVFEGKTFGSPDALAPAGFVRMGEKALYQDHVYPLWNPYVFLGMPSFGSGAYNPLIYPPDWPLALVQKVVPLPEMTWLLLYYFLGGLFLYLLAVEWGASPLGAILGASAFAFLPNLVAVGAWGHGSQLVDSAYLPLLVWLAARWLKRGGLHHLGWLALAGGFQLLRGHVQVCFYTWMAIGLFTAVEVVAVAMRRRDELGRVLLRAGGIVVAGGLAFGLAGFYNLPLRDYARWSIRGAGEGGGLGMQRATAWSLAPYELPTLVVPGWTGFGGATYWGDMPFTDYPNAFVGMVTVLLLLPAFVANGSARVFALLLSIAALLIAFGSHTPLYGFLYDHLPLFNKFRVPVMIVVLVGFAASLGAAWGWTEVLSAAEGDPGHRRRVARWLLAAAILLAVAWIAVAALPGTMRGYAQMAMDHKRTIAVGQQGFGPQEASLAWGEFSRSLTRGALLGLLVIALAWMTARRRVPPALATGIALALLLFELWPVDARVMERAITDTVPHSLDVGRDDTIDFLEHAGPPGSFRILPEEFQTNRFAGFGIASVGGYHAAKPKLVQDLLDRDLQRNSSWLRLLNVRYVVLASPLQGELSPGVRVVHQGSSQVLELPALPRATLVSQVRVVRPATAILDSIAAGHVDSGTTALMEEDPGVRLGPLGNARADIASYGMNDVAVQVRSEGPALLRLADLWYPDWVATVDGQPAKVWKVDYLLRGVLVPAGSHRVEFHFRSPSVRDGLRLSIGSLFVAIGLLVAGLWMRRRPVREEPASGAA